MLHDIIEGDIALFLVASLTFREPKSISVMQKLLKKRNSKYVKLFAFICMLYTYCSYSLNNGNYIILA